MPDNRFPVPINKVEESLPGPPLNSETAATFEQAYTSFVEDKSKQEKAEEVIEEMANLLTVSHDNLEQIQNQKWFQRAWRTITGKNKKLERINQANLLKVQKGALFFLQNLAETNGQLMETVAFALQRIEDIQIESAKLKGYLIQIVQKYNNKIHRIEGKLDQHDEAIQNLQHKGGQTLWLVLAIVALMLTIASYFLGPDEIRSPLSLSFLVAASIFLVLSFRRIIPQPASNLATLTSSPTQEENQILLPQVADEIYSRFADYVNHNLISTPMQEFAEKNDLLTNLYQRANQSGLDKPTMASIINGILDVQPVSFHQIVSIVQQCSIGFCDFHRALVSSICREHLSNSVGLDVLSSVDFPMQSQLADEVIEAFQPYSAQFENITETRKQLLGAQARFNQLMHESGWLTFGKGVLEGLTWGVLSPSTDDDNFINEYFSTLTHYGQLWDNLALVILNSVVQLNIKTYDEAIRSALNKMQPLFDEFNTRDLSLRPLLNQLRNGRDE